MKCQREISYYIDGNGVLCCRLRKLCMLSWKDDIYLNIDYRHIGAYKIVEGKPTIWSVGSKKFIHGLWPIRLDWVVSPTSDLIFVEDTVKFMHSEMGHDFTRVKIVTYAPQELKRSIRSFVKGE